MNNITTTIPTGWVTAESADLPNRIRRDYDCGARGYIHSNEDGAFTAGVWRDGRHHSTEVLLPSTKFAGFDSAVDACNDAVRRFPPIEHLKLDEAYRRIDIDGGRETLLVADVHIPRKTVEEFILENWFVQHAGKVTLKFSASGDITAECRADEEDER